MVRLGRSVGCGVVLASVPLIITELVVLNDLEYSVVGPVLDVVLVPFWADVDVEILGAPLISVVGLVVCPLLMVVDRAWSAKLVVCCVVFGEVCSALVIVVRLVLSWFTVLGHSDSSSPSGH